MTKQRLAKIAASIALAPFYGLAWCVGILVRVIVAIGTALLMGLCSALFGEGNVAD